MERFGYVRAHDKTEAIALARRAKTAQQGADIRYIAGGTTLVTNYGPRLPNPPGARFGAATLDHLTRSVAACIIDGYQPEGADNRSRVRS